MKTKLLPLVLLVGCTSIPQALDPQKVYKMDLSVATNGVPSEGVSVVQASPKYRFDVKSRGKMDLLTITSCHREFSQQGLDNKFSYEFTPQPIELEPGCPVYFGVYEKEKGRNGWALVDFGDLGHKLKAQVICNGVSFESNGVSICQSKSGLIQLVKFNKPVKNVILQGCPVKTVDHMNFEIPAPSGHCTFEFMDENTQFHRLTVVGYDEILIQGG